MLSLKSITVMAILALTQLGTASPAKAPKESATSSTRTNSATSATSATSVASSGPTYCPAGSKQTANPQLATFDDAESGTSQSFVTVPYKQVYYQAYRKFTLTGSEPIDVIPNSGTSYASTGTISQTAQGSPMMTVNYPGSTVKAIDLYSFYYACGTAAQLYSTPQACTLTLSCYSGSDNTVANSNLITAQTFQYNPTTMTGRQQMAYGQLNSAFRGCSFITQQYTINNTPALQSALVGFIDTLSYTTYNCT